MNKHVLNSKVVVFLGAGSSEFLGKPLMTGFVDKLLEEPHITLDLKKIIRTIIQVKGKDLEIILNEIDGICDRTYFIGSDKANYLKALFDLNVEAHLARLLQGTATQESSLPSESKFGKIYENLYVKCNSLRWRIYDAIFRIYHNVDEQKTKSLYKPFFDIIKTRLNGKKITIPVFTTNYDKAIEKFDELDKAIELVDGFYFSSKKKMRTWNIKSFDNFSPKVNKTNLCLFKLHGSIFWYRVDGKIIDSPIATFFPSNENIEPVILYPNDVKKIIFDPFITSYCYLQNCLTNAQFIIFVGYSFRDYITISYLKNALRANNKAKVFIIDPQASKLKKRLFGYYKERVICEDKRFTDKVEDYEESLSKFLEMQNKV